MRSVAASEDTDATRWLVRSTEAVHVQPFLDSLAYRIETPTAGIVVTGDTGPCDSVVDLARGATALVQHVLGPPAGDAGVR